MLYTRSLLYAAEITRATGAQSIMDVLVNAFGDLHGIDTAETVTTMKSIASLDHIGTVERVADGDTSAPVQAADLIGYTRFRYALARAFVAARDPAFAETHLVGVAELRHRLHAVTANEPVGVSVLTDTARTQPSP